MKTVLLTQQALQGPHEEHHDSLDQRWSQFLSACDVLPILVPNHPPSLKHLLQTLPIDGIVLSGGGEHDSDLADTRSQIEALLIAESSAKNIPLIGVCRGMQALMQQQGAKLVPCKGQVTLNQSIVFKGAPLTVNSYHNFTVDSVPASFSIIAHTPASDEQGIIVKAIKAKEKPWLGIMWHPERHKHFMQSDIHLFSQFLTTGQV